MNNQLLSQIAIIVSILALACSVIAIFFSGKARTWHRYFKAEEQPENLEDIIEIIAAKIKALENGYQENSESLLRQGTTLATAIQHVGLIRFDSGADDGGNLSFTAAFLNAHQSGIVLTSLHGRQHNRIYTKHIYQGTSEQTLSEEEKEAVIQAITNK